MHPVYSPSPSLLHVSLCLTLLICITFSSNFFSYRYLADIYRQTYPPPDFWLLSSMVGPDMS